MVPSYSTNVLTKFFSFFNGGLLFSIITFTFIALISLYSFLLLVKTKFVVSGSFGGTTPFFFKKKNQINDYKIHPSLSDIGGALYGHWMRYLILGSIVVSQVGFVAAYTIFVAENLQVSLSSFYMAPTVLKNIAGFRSRCNQLSQVNPSPILHSHATCRLFTPRPRSGSCEIEFNGPHC